MHLASKLLSLCLTIKPALVAATVESDPREATSTNSGHASIETSLEHGDIGRRRAFSTSSTSDGTWSTWNECFLVLGKNTKPCGTSTSSPGISSDPSSFTTSSSTRMITTSSGLDLGGSHSLQFESQILNKTSTASTKTARFKHLASIRRKPAITSSASISTNETSTKGLSHSECSFASCPSGASYGPNSNASGNAMSSNGAQVAEHFRSPATSVPAAKSSMKSIPKDLNTTMHNKLPTPPSSRYGSGNWSTNKCSVALTGNTGYSNLQMWTEADAQGTWDYISNSHYDSSINWSSFVARELNFSSWQEYQCQEMSTDNVCMYQEDCAAPITPGAWMVVNSMANLWGYHWDLYNTVQTAHAQVDVDLVVNNFSPQFDEAAYLQHEIFLTGLTFGIMMALGAIFSIGAELAVAAADIAATAAEAAEIATMAAGFEAEGATAAEAAAKAAAKAATSKTVSTAGRTAGILLAHDTIASVTMYEIMTARYADGTAEDGLAAQNVMTDLVGNYTDRWQKSEASFIGQLFNGSKSSIKYVGDAIANGTWLTPWNETSSHDNFTSTALPLMVKHMYGTMIPYGWAAATKSKNPMMPVIIMMDGCAQNLTDIIPPPQQKKPPVRFDKNVDEAKVCFQDKTFWVLTPYKTGHHYYGLSHNVAGTDRVRFEIPPGLTMLTGASDVFGGLSIEDIVVSSYYAWGNNSYMNPAPKPQAASVLQEDVWSQSVRYPGFFNYPICDGLSGVLAAGQSYWDKSYTSPC